MDLAELKETIFVAARDYIEICNGHSGKNLGEYKYDRHAYICNCIYDFLFPSNAEYKNQYRSIPIHDASEDLTSFLDEEIGLPLDRKLSAREVEIYTNKFINKIVENLDKFKKAVIEYEKEN